MPDSFHQWIAPPWRLNGYTAAADKSTPAPCRSGRSVAEAARSFGFGDDRVRLAISEAAVRQGGRVGRWDEAVSVAAAVSGLTPSVLLTRAQSPEAASRVAETTAEFHALQVTQRPTFLVTNPIGDRAVLSGLAKVEPLVAVVDALLAGESSYASWEAHFGEPPQQ